MKLTFAAIATLLSFGASALAQEYNITSKPFSLQLASRNVTLNGKSLGQCHEGAAIESLCLYEGDVVKNFHLNSTSPEYGGKKNQGVLTFNLPIGGDPAPSTVPEGLRGYFNLATNVVHLQFFPGSSYESFMVNFDASNHMFVQVYYNDKVVPATASTASSLYNFYMCQVNYAGYIYETLNFVQGRGKVVPQNPTCQKVDVIRKFT